MSPATPQAKLPRYHSLDRLRAIMMLLGLVLHSAINYFPFPDEYLDQIYLDTKSSPFFDYLVKFIHSFRMPVFFVMAGFFAAFLFDTRGAVGFLRHRWQRVGVPLIGAWIVVYPVTAVCSIYANSLSTGRTLSALASGTVSLEHLLSTVLLHLWFLYYLLIYCVIAVLMAPLLLRFRARDGILDAFQHAAPAHLRADSMGRIHWPGALSDEALDVRPWRVPDSEPASSHGVWDILRLRLARLFAALDHSGFQAARLGIFCRRTRFSRVCTCSFGIKGMGTRPPCVHMSWRWLASPCRYGV